MMSTTEDNKKFVLEFVHYLANGEVQKLLDSMADDAQWTLVGHSDISPAACTKNKEQVKIMAEGVAVSFPEGLKFMITGVTAEGDRVAVEVESYGVLSNGNVYNNLYHMLYETRDGKIQNVREYTDWNYVKATMG
jgi:ketosteroid isomerase-like protein